VGFNISALHASGAAFTHQGHAQSQRDAAGQAETDTSPLPPVHARPTPCMARALASEGPA